MENATFRKWLAGHGCRFDTQSKSGEKVMGLWRSTVRANYGTAVSRCGP